MVKKKSPFLYVAGACFALLTVLEIVSSVSNIIRFVDIGYYMDDPASVFSLGLNIIVLPFFWLSAFILVAVGLFVNKPVIAAIGGGIGSLLSLYHAIQYLILLFGAEEYNRMSFVCLLVTNVLLLAAWLLLFLTMLLRKGTLVTGILSGSLFALDLVFWLLVPLFIPGYSRSLLGHVSTLIDAAGAVFAGLALWSMRRQQPPAFSAPNPPAPPYGWGGPQY